MGGEIDIPYFAIMNMAVVVQRVVGITMNLKQSKHGTDEQVRYRYHDSCGKTFQKNQTRYWH